MRRNPEVWALALLSAAMGLMTTVNAAASSGLSLESLRHEFAARPECVGEWLEQEVEKQVETLISQVEADLSRALGSL